MSGERRPGRPRSEESRGAILAAALEGLREHGFAALTIEGIAGRAGVGKQTIYRWWPSKADVVLDALLDQAEETIRVPDEGSLRADLTAFLGATFRQTHQRPVLVGLMGQALLDPGFALAFRERFLFRRRGTLRELFDRAISRGEIAAGVDPELLVDVVYGVLWYRLMLDHAPLDGAASRQLTELVLRAVR
ncbi:TetR/AcrR family transcriptional regulator C-terminal ligand-binding domain-containing protein [Streptomyces roseirectus]|uniref:TetR/AcrR family transcriptional regulator C-terminal ligand-binding domain-containing protein n=1 Tax=Streptomyces roseirectus TaxID=2768066 RepID=A0A7H0I7F1_9ACTN|nr:TetR/AcrR family transcriptional regulator [Streptomyces roseirectus]QNP68717.1 TetR/AcrR family transcriptional regulator C-terminal ligand-binding domain-containing protein [Streptomyces roseirectus]